MKTAAIAFQLSLLIVALAFRERITLLYDKKSCLVSIVQAFYVYILVGIAKKHAKKRDSVIYSTPRYLVTAPVV